MGDIFGLLKFRIFFGVLEIPDIYFGVNGRCWARAYVYRKKESTPPLGLKPLVPNYYFAFSYCPLGALVRFSCGEEAQQFNASLSQPNVQKNSRALVRGWGGGA